MDLVTCFVTLHHVSDLKTTLSELARILRPGGYLILREHDSEKEYCLTAKYLHFIHAIMMIARVGEFAHLPPTDNSSTQEQTGHKYWKEQKLRIIEYTKTIHYRTHNTWNQELMNVGFQYRATFDYSVDGSQNPQKLFYGVYQLRGTK